MRKITVLSMLSLDGVMQAPGGKDEDPTNGFEYGGWSAPFSDEIFNEVVKKELEPADYLLGRKTFEIWANYWPQHADFWPGINEGSKYVFSESLSDESPLVANWNKSKVISDLEEIKRLKESEGADLQVWGSSKLIPLLLEHDLVDELKLKIYPIVLGKGKKIFDGNAVPTSFHLVDTTITSKGVIIATYQKAGSVKTGNITV